MAMLRHAFIFGLSAIVVGCSSSSSGTGDTTDSATDAGADVVDTARDTTLPPDDTTVDDTPAVDTPSEAGCASVTNIATEVTEQEVNTTMPVAGGGLVADGTYTITDVTKYTGPSGPHGPGTYKVTETIMISGGGIDIAGVRKVGDAPGYQYTAEIAPEAGAKLKWKQSCPDSPGVTYDYDATSDSFVVYDTTLKTGTTYTLKFHTPGP